MITMATKLIGALIGSGLFVALGTAMAHAQFFIG
jgi:amino acid permease